MEGNCGSGCGLFKYGKLRFGQFVIPRPLDEGCGCPCCAGYSRAYLHHVLRAQEIIASMLLTWHNLHYYQELMAGLRGAIAAAGLAGFVAGFHELRAGGDIEPL